MSIKDVSKIRAIIRDYKKVVLKLEELVKCKIGIKKILTIAFEVFPLIFPISFCMLELHMYAIYLRYFSTAVLCILLALLEWHEENSNRGPDFGSEVCCFLLLYE